MTLERHVQSVSWMSVGVWPFPAVCHFHSYFTTMSKQLAGYIEGLNPFLPWGNDWLVPRIPVQTNLPYYWFVRLIPVKTYLPYAGIVFGLGREQTCSWPAMNIKRTKCHSFVLSLQLSWNSKYQLCACRMSHHWIAHLFVQCYGGY